MKIGILTFHCAHNYGAVLQAYALKKVITDMGHEVCIINYCNKKIESQYPKNLDTENKQKQNDWTVKYTRFSNFINEKLLDLHLDKIEIAQIKDSDFDCFIVGSDQVWEPGLTGGLDNTYLLDFCDKQLKVSYAASKSIYRMDDDTASLFLAKLKTFDYVSVREKSLGTWIERCGIKTRVVLDPTLLLNDKDYEVLSSATVYKKPYILVYYVTEESGLSEYAKILARKRNLDIVEIHYYRIEKDNIIQMSDSGPQEFLALIRDAKYVVTNSFHGVVFSIIYGKEFYAYYEEDTRKSDLLQLLGIENRHVWATDIVDNSEIDYEKVNALLSENIEKSKHFLYDALKNEKG